MKAVFAMDRKWVAAIAILVAAAIVWFDVGSEASRQRIEAVERRVLADQLLAVRSQICQGEIAAGRNTEVECAIFLARAQRQVEWVSVGLLGDELEKAKRTLAWGHPNQ